MAFANNKDNCKTAIKFNIEAKLEASDRSSDSTAKRPVKRNVEDLNQIWVFLQLLLLSVHSWFDLFRTAMPKWPTSLLNTLCCDSLLHPPWNRLAFPTGRDSETFRDNGTEVPSLSRDKGTTV